MDGNSSFPRESSAPAPAAFSRFRKAWTGSGSASPRRILTPRKACLVNFYAPSAKLGLDQDRDEEDFDAPVGERFAADTQADGAAGFVGERFMSGRLKTP
jgi:alkylated DNA repair protein (DNA oxidative demethylase)